MMQIDLSREADVPAIMQFLDEHWSHGHPLAVSRTLMDFQHRHDNGYGFVIARRSNAIIGILGYISIASFDPALSDKDTLWLTTWKVRDDSGSSAVGMMLLAALRERVPCHALGTIGMNAATEPLYRGLGFRVGTLGHYTAFHPGHREFHLAHVPTDIREALHRPTNGSGRLIPVSRDDLRNQTGEDYDFGERNLSLPVKSPVFFANRYLDHPFYRYDVRMIQVDGHPRGLLAFRLLTHDGHRALRLVDVYCDNEPIAKISGSVVELLEQYDAEYLQLYATGISETALSKAGFHVIPEEGSLRVPLHFEPFDPSNKTLRYTFSSSAENFDTSPILVTGDADQDRPGDLSLMNPVENTL